MVHRATRGLAVWWLVVASLLVASSSEGAQAVTLVPRASSPVLTLTGPAVAGRGEVITLHGSISDPTATVLYGYYVVVTRTDSSGTTTLPTVSVVGQSAFVVQDTLGQSDATYTASTYGATDVTWTVLARTPSEMVVGAPATSPRTVAYTFSGTLTTSGAPQVGQTVSLTRTDLAGTTTTDVVTDASGAYSLQDTPEVGGRVTWTASWAGDSTHAPEARSIAVLVLRLATTMTVASTVRAVSFSRRAVIKVHLGTTYNSRVVEVYAHPYNSRLGVPGALVARGTVDSHGDFTTTYRMTYNTVFTAKFVGDHRYDSRTRAVTVMAIPRLSLSAWKPIKRSGQYYVLKAPIGAIRGTTQPGYRYCVYWYVQQLVGSRWKAVGPALCGGADLDRHPWLRLYQARKGERYRVRLAMKATPWCLGGSSAWRYVLFQ